MSLINTQVQPFKTQAFHNGKFIEVTDQSLKGKWNVLIFMPAAFTFNCPTEIEDAADNYAEFQKAGAEVYIVTTDTHFSHKVWHETSPAVGKAKFPLVGDFDELAIVESLGLERLDGGIDQGHDDCLFKLKCRTDWRRQMDCIEGYPFISGRPIGFPQFENR